MKLTDQTVRISELAGQVNGFAENKEYDLAHSALDEIFVKVRHLHMQLNDLRRQDDFSTKLKEGP